MEVKTTDVLDTIEKYCVKLEDDAVEGELSLEELQRKIEIIPVFIDNIKEIIPENDYAIYEEFFEKFKLTSAQSKNIKLFEQNIQVIFDSLHLFIECISCIKQNVVEISESLNKEDSSDYEESEILEEIVENGPLVSVIMSCYNHEEYVEEAVKSVINQSYKNIEFIVADDGSSDCSVDVLRKYSKYFSQELYFEDNKGGRFKELISKVNGKYVAVINSDDIWEKDKLLLQVNYLERHPNVDAAFTWCEYFGDVEESEREVFKVTNKSKSEWLRSFYYGDNRLCYPSILIKKDIYIDIYNTAGKGLRQLSDYFLWIELVQKSEIHVIQKELTKMRRHSGDKTVNMSAFSIDNKVRSVVEKMYNWLHVIDKMDKQVFIDAFREDFINKEAFNDQQIKCEKFFLMYNIDFKMYQNNAICYFYKIYQEQAVRECFEKEYSFSIKKYFNEIADKGFNFLIKENLEKNM